MVHFYYQNVRGLRTKTLDLFNNVVCNNYDVVILSETWLNSSVFDSELFDSRYVVYRRDRETSGFHSAKNGGGVLIAVTKRFSSRRLSQFESKCEDLWVQVECCNDFGKNDTLHLCAVYLPPPVQKHILEEFMSNVNSVLEQNNLKNLMLIGDFNLGSIPWNHSSVTDSPKNVVKNNNNNNVFSSMFLDFTVLHSLCQYNNLQNNKGRILDLILSTIDIQKLTDCDPLTIIDPSHPPLQFHAKFVANKSLEAKQRPHFCFYKADYVEIINELNTVSWDNEFRDCTTVDEMVSVFYTIIRKSITKHVPMVRTNSRKYPIWFSRDLIGLMREKLKYRNKLRKFNNNPLDKISFDIAKKRVERLMIDCYNTYISQLEKNISSNPKLFWSFIKNKKKSPNCYPAQMSLDGSTASNGNDICNLFAQNFSADYNVDLPSSTQRSHFAMITSDYLTLIKFKDNQVLKVLKRLDSHKGAGSDGLPSIFVARCASVLTRPLTLIYNKSLSTGVFPSQWKSAIVVPLFKKGARDQVKNYRPISILPVIAKVFEQLLHPILAWHFKSLISTRQHGFMKARSTATNLSCFINDVSSELDCRSSVDAIYTDFSKAFDRVNHELLLLKLSTFGIAEPLLSWCKSYLSNRESCVVANGYSSHPFSAHSGVPQGSHLGPLLFNIFINDIGSCFAQSKYYLFADDLKFFRAVNSSTEALLLQEDLNSLTAWCEDNLMSLNVSKCFSIRFTRKKKVYTHEYKIHDTVLAQVDNIVDLGITLDSKLRLHIHIDKICSKAFKNLGFILRNSRDFKSSNTKITLFNSIVRSGLEYCSVAWNPYYDVYIKRIESVQKRFLWHLTYSCNLAKKISSYNDRLAHFKIESLADRRRMLDIVFLYKLANGHIDVPELLSSLYFSVPKKLPRHSRFNFLHTMPCKSNLGRTAPINRIVEEHNAVEKSKDLDIFCDRLRGFKNKFITNL